MTALILIFTVLCLSSCENPLGKNRLAPQNFGRDSATPDLTTLDQSHGPDWTPQWASVNAYWTFDSSPNDVITPLTGTLVGDAFISSTSKIGSSALYVDSLTDYLETNHSAALNGFSNSLSVSVWVYPDQLSSFPGFDGVVLFQSGDRLWLTIRKSDGAIRVFLAGTTNPGYHTSSAGIQDQQWSHVVITYEQVNGLKIYLNGVNVGNFNPTGPLLTGAAGVTNKFGIQFDGAGRGFKGYIDDLIVWNHELTAAEVLSIYDYQK